MTGKGHVCKGEACLQLDLLSVDILLDFFLKDLEEQLTICIPAVLPQPVQEVVPRLHKHANHSNTLRCT